MFLILEEHGVGICRPAFHWGGRENQGEGGEGERRGDRNVRSGVSWGVQVSAVAHSFTNEWAPSQARPTHPGTLPGVSLNPQLSFSLAGAQAWQVPELGLWPHAASCTLTPGHAPLHITHPHSTLTHTRVHTHAHTYIHKQITWAHTSASYSTSHTNTITAHTGTSALENLLSLALVTPEPIPRPRAPPRTCPRTLFP